MVHFVGAGPGAPDLITQRGAAFLQAADCIIYAGSLVNPALLGLAKPGCAIYNSAEMTLEQVLDVMRRMEAAGKSTVRLHTGDPCLYGAIREQMDVLDAEGIPYDDTPGVSSFCGAAAALNAEYTLPTVSQTVIITRMEGRTPVPEKEKLASLAAHGATMVIFLSIGLVDKVQQALLEGGAYTPDTPAAVVYKATWPEEKTVRCTVGTLAESVHAAGITKTALIVAGGFLGRNYERSKLGKALLSALNTIKLHAEAEKNDVLEQLQAALAENTRLNNQLTELQSSRAAYEDSLENLYESSSWRLTAPLRALRRLLRG